MKKTLKGFTVYLDLDGVMANFDKAWYDSYGFTKDDWEYRQEHVAKKAPFFFLELEEMPDAVKLWKYLVKSDAELKVLTARPKRIWTNGEADEQKRTWFAKRFCPKTEVIVCYGEEKQKYAGPTTILIDDRVRNVAQFSFAGGIGILHRDAKHTIQYLKEIKILNGEKQ
jgi:5'(3')-deoxyribonucleotidase